MTPVDTIEPAAPCDEEWEALARDADASWSPWARFAHLFAFDDDDQPPSDAELLRRMRDCEALVTQLTALQGRDLLELRRRRVDAQRVEHPHDGACRTACCDPHGWVSTEVGIELGLSERQVTARIETAASLAEHVDVAEAVEQGRLQVWTATKLLDYLDMLAVLLPRQQVARIESATVSWLLEHPRTVSQLGARMRRLLLAARQGDEPRPAVSRRQVRVQPGDDVGMAEVRAVLPEADALAVRACLDAFAARPVGSDDTRTVDQRRADLLVALVTGAPARHGHAGDVAFALRPPGRTTLRLDVTVPAQALLGSGAQPAEVPGYGPVPASTARDLAEAAEGSARPLVYDESSGRLLGFAAPMTWLADLRPGSGYQHPPTLDAAIRARDRHCRAPGCTRPAARCDCDHVVPYPHGATTVANGCCLCRRHHRLKTHAVGWDVAVGEDGTLRWTTPTGRETATAPGDYSPVGIDAGADVPPF